MPGPLRRQSWWNTDRRLVQLLTKFSDSEATREHDRIYALLGVSSDAPDLPIEYACPFPMVVARTASLLSFGDTSLRCLLQHERAPDFFEVFRDMINIEMMVLRLFELALKSSDKDLFEYLTKSTDIRAIADDTITEYKWEQPYFRSIFYLCTGRDKKDAPTTFESTFKAALARSHYLVCIKICQLEGVVPSDDDFEKLLPWMSNSSFQELVRQKYTLNEGSLAYVLNAVVRSGHGEQIQILLDLGVDGGSLLTESLMNQAVVKDNVETTRFLLQRHEITRGSLAKSTLATRLLWRGLRIFNKEALLHLLIDCGADIEASQQGKTLLRSAVGSNNYHAVRVLIKRGADYKSPDKYGQTSLHIAEEKDHPGIVAMLLAHGADHLALDEDGRTPWQLNKGNTSEEETRNAAQLEDCLRDVREPRDREVFRQALLLLGKDKEEDVEDQSEEATDTNYTWKCSKALEESRDATGFVHNDAPIDRGLPIREKGIINPT
ncbi:hypothetical protein PG984_007076 [Apiospora sp. TS-2023a]